MLRLSSHAGAGQRPPPIPGERLSPPHGRVPPGPPRSHASSPLRGDVEGAKGTLVAGRWLAERGCAAAPESWGRHRGAPSSRMRPQEPGAPGAPPARTRHLAPRSKLLLEPSLGKALPGWVLSRDGDQQPLTSRDTLLVSFCFFPFFPPLKINPRLSSSKSAELMLHGKL